MHYYFYVGKSLSVFVFSFNRRIYFQDNWLLNNKLFQSQSCKRNARRLVISRFCCSLFKSVWIWRRKYCTPRSTRPVRRYSWIDGVNPHIFYIWYLVNTSRKGQLFWLDCLGNLNHHVSHIELLVVICTGFNEKMLYVCLSVVNYTVERKLMVKNVIFHSLSIFQHVVFSMVLMHQ